MQKLMIIISVCFVLINVAHAAGENGIPADKKLQPVYLVENKLLRYELDRIEKTISVADKRVNQKWMAFEVLNSLSILEVDKTDAYHLELKIADQESAQYKVTITLAQDTAEVFYLIEQAGNGKFTRLEFPPFFKLEGNMQLVVPLQEGLLLPANLPAEEFPGILRYHGWDLCMPFAGVIEGEKGWMEIVETPYDFEIARDKDKNGSLKLKNRWISEKGDFGYSRRIRYRFFDKGGYVAMAKHYRQYANNKGLIQTLKEKDTKRKGNISRLMGAVDVWYWGKDQADLAEEMAGLGFKKVLLSKERYIKTDERSIKKINDLGFLTSNYDCYQDAYPPDLRQIIHWVEGWPDDLVLDENGEQIKGWTMRKEGREYTAGVVCSIPGLKRAQARIPDDLKENPYSVRFIDTTTCTPARECFSPKHPTTRSEDINHKKELLRFSSEDLHLVTGSENGVDWAVPVCDYFEGMMSIVTGRLPDSGRNVGAVAYVEPTKEFLKYEVGEKHRIPLWELVYGGCVVSTWYWDDSSNRIPEVWNRRDLFNILYGNMPLFAIRDRKHWEQYRERFVKTHLNVCPVFEKVGFEEMLSHKFISNDCSVQETTFTNDIRIVVNFGNSNFPLKEGNKIIPAGGFAVFEKDELWKVKGGEKKSE